MKCVVIGGANVDIQGYPDDTLIFANSNPGKINISSGGVGRNIADNLTRLGVDTILITALGRDAYGNAVLANAAEIGLNMDYSLILENYATPMYLSILDENGDMACAVSCMDALKKLDIEYLKTKYLIIRKADLIIIDANLSFETIDNITKTFHDIPIIFDTVSVVKGLKCKSVIYRFHTIKPNRIEAETLTGFTIKDENDAKKAIEYFLNIGVKRVFLTLGRDGMYFGDCENFGYLRQRDASVVSATGAGDAFVAGLAYCFLNKMPVDYTAKFSQAAAMIALKHKNTINPEMCVKKVVEQMEELN